MKKVVGTVVSFIAVYIVFLVVTAPASLLVQWGDIPKNVHVGEVTGSIWSPKVASIDVQGVRIEQLDANLSPLSLLTLSPSVDATFGGSLSDGPSGNAELSVSGNTVTLTDTNIELPASLIAPHIQSPIPVDAFGLVNMTLNELDYQNGQCSVADGKVKWQRASVSALEQEIDLGDLSGALSCEEQLITLTILPDNNLGLSFKAQLTQQGRLTGTGFIKPGAKFPRQLKDALMFLGKPDNQGRYRIFM